MKAIAIIPARGGSKGILRKNVRLLCGKPLLAWMIDAAAHADTVSRVVVSTDDAEIGEVGKAYGAEIVWRPQEISGDTSPSEAALLHALNQLQVTSGYLAFLQCTSPLIIPEDIDGTVALLQNADSAFTAIRWHHFLWQRTDEGATPIGHHKGQRLMRQQCDTRYLEVGAVYAMKTAGFLAAQHRFFGRTDMYVIPPERGLEIDTPTDLALAETLLRQRLNQAKVRQLPKNIAAVVTDFDGVLTDNRVYVNESGAETVACHRGDGWALRYLMNAGIRVLVLTNEKNASVMRRCEKLAVECMVADGDKLPALQRWLELHQIKREEVIYVGNDVPDVPCMQYVACGVAPADAYDAAIKAAAIVLNTDGGHGCIRELIHLINDDKEATYGMPFCYR